MWREKLCGCGQGFGRTKSVATDPRALTCCVNLSLPDPIPPTAASLKCWTVNEGVVFWHSSRTCINAPTHLLWRESTAKCTISFPDEK